jgi:hypothetical protein
MLALRRAPLRNRRVASMSAIWRETAVQQCPLPALNRHRPRWLKKSVSDPERDMPAYKQRNDCLSFKGLSLPGNPFAHPLP